MSATASEHLGRQTSFIATSFDGHRVGRCPIRRPDRYAFFDHGAGPYMIARGAGLSYAPASFGEGSVSIDMRSFDRILEFLPDDRTVTVEAGISLGALHCFLAQRGLYLPVQPGHGSISVGGCIAADVHGKNQRRDGTFHRQVLALSLFHPRHGIVDLAADKNPDVFAATCGGYGTTGVIISAKLRATAIPSNSISVDVERIRNPSDIIPRLVAAQQFDFSYSWHNFSTLNEHFGEGYLIKARFTDSSVIGRKAATRCRRRELSAESRSFAGFCLFNRLSTRAVNFIHHRGMKWTGPRKRTLEQVLFPLHGSEAYFSAFGRSGFHEYQAIIPTGAFDRFISGLRGSIGKSRVPVTLASAKLFGGNAEFLRFSGEGICFALNFPKSLQALSLLNDLDHLLLEAGGRPNIIKDSRLPRSVIQATYPHYDELRAIISGWDPKRQFRSALTDRIGL